MEEKASVCGDTVSCQVDCFAQELFTTMVETKCTGHELLKTVWHAACPAGTWDLASFFGIQVVQPKKDSLRDVDKPNYWLEANESLRRLLTDNLGTRSFRRDKHKLHLGVRVEREPLLMKLRIRFYPSNPINLQHCFFRSYLFKQIREDIKLGMLIFPAKAVEMNVASLILIHDAMNCAGNTNEEAHTRTRRQSFFCVNGALGRLSRVRTGSILFNQVPRQVNEIISSARYLLAEDAQLNPMVECNYDLRVLDIVKTLDSYAVHPTRAEDQQDGSKAVYIGLNYRGVIVFKSSGTSQLYKWTDVQHLSFTGKIFKMQVPTVHCGYAINSSWWGTQRHHKSAQSSTGVRYKFDSAAVARRLWFDATAHRIFFGFEKKARLSRTESGEDLHEVLLSRSSPFRFLCLKSFSKPEVFAYRGKLSDELQAVLQLHSNSVSLELNRPSEPACQLRESEQFVSFKLNAESEQFFSFKIDADNDSSSNE